MKYLLDTNVLSELVAEIPNARVVAWVDAQEVDNLYLSAITVGELSKGIEKLPNSKRKDALRDWLQDDLLLRFSGRILALDAEAMLIWGSMVARLERSGRPIAALDSLIAALGLLHNCCLVTRNEDDFKDTGISVFNPWNA
jgi:toxin FitB